MNRQRMQSGLVAALGAAVLAAGATKLHAQGYRREGRIAAREDRREARFDARNYGNWNQGYGYGYGPAYGGPAGYPGGYNLYGYAGPGGYGGYGGPGAYGYGGAGGYGARPPGFYAPRPGGNPNGPYSQDLVYHGRERSLLGVTLGETPQGAVTIRNVTPDSPADIAGLRRGDEILSINGRQVYSYRDATRIVADHLPNQVIELSIGRNGRERLVQAVLGARPASDRPPMAQHPDGFPSNREYYRSSSNFGNAY